MTPSHPLQPVSEWDPRLPRMVVVSLLGHVAVLALVVLLTPLAGPRPLPMIAYTVEITDPSALGGRTPPGAPGKQLTGGATVPAPAGGAPKPPEPEAKAEPAPVPVKPPEPKPEPAAVKVPEPKVEPKPPPKPEPKPEPRAVVPPKPEPKPEPVAKAEPPKPVAKPEPKLEPKPEAKPEPRKPEPPKPEATAAAKPAPASKPEAAGRAGGQAAAESPPQDAYGAAAERWRQKSAGGGLGGQDTGSGPIGAGGDGKGGGGQLVGIEFLAYRQQVINAVKGAWANVLTRPGLVAKVRFEIAVDGTVSGIRLEQGSGNPAYDASALRAVQRANPLPPPPARYAGEFRDFVIEFHSEETGGQGTG